MSRETEIAKLRQNIEREQRPIGDRAEAILSGVDGLQAGDALLIAGKGHETGQEAHGVVHPFDDAEQARAAVLALDGDEGVIIER